MNQRNLKIVIVFLFVTTVSVLGQPSTSPSPSPTPPSFLSDLDTVVKIIGGIITALITIIGIPVGYATYRKTKAEITKIELEAKELRNKQSDYSTQENNEDGIIRINISNSTDTNIKILADPRFLAPLLILLDFIFASIVLSLAGHLFSMFNIGFIDSYFLTFLSAVLFLPILRQVLRVRAVLRPPKSEEEIRASTRQARIAVYLLFAFSVCLLLIFGILLNSVGENLTTTGRYLSWILIIVGSLLALASPLLKRWFDKYLARIQKEDRKEWSSEE